MAWDKLSYNVAGVYLPALINGDWSGLSKREEADLNWFVDAVDDDMRERGALWWHWSCDSDEPSFRRCEVSGLQADTYEIEVVFQYDTENV